MGEVLGLGLDQVSVGGVFRSCPPSVLVGWIRSGRADAQGWGGSSAVQVWHGTSVLVASRDRLSKGAPVRAFPHPKRPTIDRCRGVAFRPDSGCAPMSEPGPDRRAEGVRARPPCAVSVAPATETAHGGRRGAGEGGLLRWSACSAHISGLAGRPGVGRSA
ncbi:hypothetical protein YT1_1334 [Rhodococcus ruber]|nr:hypothetical protein YT1_1334 [Rhodococcus ruber]